jgi:histidine triad (HIT) family protein
MADRDPGCVFCAIVAGEAPASVLWRDDETVAFLDVNPWVPGHALVVPRRHEPELYGLRDEESAAVMRTAVAVAERLRTALQPDGVNLFHATGRAAFQTVFHFHIHVLPRRTDDGIVLPITPRPADRDDLDALAARIRVA